MVNLLNGRFNRTDGIDQGDNMNFTGTWITRNGKQISVVGSDTLYISTNPYLGHDYWWNENGDAYMNEEKYPELDLMIRISEKSGKVTD